MMTLLLTTIVFSSVYIFYAGHSAQSRQITDYIDLQRDARRVLRQLRKDVLELVYITSGERNGDQTMTVLAFDIAADVDLLTPVRYEFDVTKRTLRKNGKILIRDSIKDIKIWFLDRDGRDVFEANTFEETFAIRFRITIAALERNIKDDNQSTVNKKKSARERTIDFAVYPRTPVSKIKAKEGKLNLTTGRFAVSRNSGGRLSVTPSNRN